MADHQCVKPQGIPETLCAPGIYFECPDCGATWIAHPWGDEEVCWQKLQRGSEAS